LALDLDAGGIWDPTEQAGVSRLAAEALLLQLHPRLAALGASARLQCEESGLRFTMLAPPATWRPAAELLLEGVFHPSLAQVFVDTARARLLRSLRFQQGDPAAEIRVAARESLFGVGHRWATGACGRPETIEPLTRADAEGAASQRFAPSRAVATLAGPVTIQDGAEVLRALGESRLPVLLPLPQPAPLPGTRDIESPTITSWLALSFPLPPEPDDEATRFLAESLARSLRPSPLRPEVVDAAVEVERFGGGGALVVYLAVEPRNASGWITRVRQLVEGAGAAPMDENEFTLLRRRYRGVRLLALATPEARAADAADRLFFDHAFALPEARIDALNIERVRAAAAALAPPAIAYLGPARADAAPVERKMRQP
ncbi:MAG TPA: hypothetical protein VF832_00340, partial [Longimicrobiales bacterium]